MSGPGERGRAALDLARRGDLAGAIAAGEEAIGLEGDNPGLRLFLGAISCRQGELERGIGHFRAALALAPGDPMARAELGRALLSAGELDEVEALTGSGEDVAHPIGRELLRLRAHARRRKDDAGEAARLYGLLVAADAADFESWQGLGLARLGSGDAAGALDPLRRALQLRPRLAAAQSGLGRALLALERLGEARDALVAAEALDPADPAIPVELSRVEVLLSAFDRGEAAIRRALALAPDHAPALAALGDMLERANRLDELEALLDGADARGVRDPSLTLIRARLLRRRGRLEEALAAVRADEDDDPLRAQTIGEIADQMGDAETAFAAFTRMNELVLAASPEAEEEARDLRSTVTALSRITTADWYRSWPAPARRGTEARPDPAFLFGFPRSGTTLLDTMLMGHPETAVLEEQPFLQRVADRIGGAERLPLLSEAEIEELRAYYWRQVDAAAPHAPGRLVIDKFPLGLIGLPFIHRLFPQARYIFAERHPCDCVLSCFITRFRLNAAMANFLKLENAARLYDLALGYWEQARKVFALPVKAVRYERMIVDAEAELRPLADFLGLEWNPALVDHRGSAAARAYITSPSYSQVTEPLYTRARGRWRRYARQMEPVLPLLAPWAERMGYSL
ncbi:MAG TPA: sulfotransferase [Sphingomonas sp.]|nr:sulfotransferase [Sphingomonas sp.]